MGNFRFAEGDNIAVREFWRGKIWWANPAIVVEDTDDAVAFFTRPGAVGKAAAWARYEDACQMRFAGDWTLGERVFHTNRRLCVARPGDPYAVSAFWRDSDGVFLGWYVDIITPLERSSVGFDMRDLELDIVVSEDLASWEWKDQEALDVRVRCGLHTPAEAEEIRTIGRRVVMLIESGGAWWQPWRTWEPELPIPELPDGWASAPTSLPPEAMAVAQ